MSTKTSIKRIALVAAAALTLGGFSAVSAHATETDTWAVTTAYASSSTTATQVVGGTVVDTFTIAGGALGETLTVTSTGGSIVNAAGTNLGTLTAVGGATIGTYPLTSLQGVTSGGSASVAITASSSVVGAQTLTAQILNASGTPITTVSATINWVASAGNVGLSTTNSVMGVVTSGTCASAATIGAGRATLSNNAVSSGYYKAAAAAGDVCIYTFDANGYAITPSAITLFTPVGFVGASTAAVGTTSSVAVSTKNSGYSIGSVKGDLLQKGAASITAIVTDSYGNSITLAAPFTFYGTLASVKLTNVVNADKASATSATSQKYVLGTAATGALSGTIAVTAGASSSTGVHSIAVTALDSAGNVIPYSSWYNDAVVKSDITTANLNIVSDKGNGNTTVGKGAQNNYSVLSLDTIGDGGATSSKNGGITVACNYAKNEHIVVTAYAYNATTAADDIKSNAVDFYCSGAPTTITVTPAATSVDGGSTTTLTAKETDANGYPVFDGNSILFAATGNGTVAPSTSGTVAGVAGTSDSNIVTFISNADGGVATITAIDSGYSLSGVSSISVAGGSGASSLSLDAANAATDAANNAYDEAQNATQAASDALAAVTALSAQVGALIATVKSLAAVVAKIKAKVKA